MEDAAAADPGARRTDPNPEDGNKRIRQGGTGEATAGVVAGGAKQFA